MGITHFSGLEVAGVPTMGIAGAPLFTGNWWFVNPASGSDGNTGAADNPFATIYQAYASAVDANNDVIVLVGNGLSSGTARMSTALAQTIVPAATTGTITWAKNATHLIGMCAPTGINARARFAPPTGVYTAATFGNSGNMFNVTGKGCFFSNFSLFNGFSTGATGQIAWKEAGGNNYYNGVGFGGMGDAASAASTTARSLTVASSENTFIGCTIGLDTVTRTVANASLEFLLGTSRNKFISCDFPVETTSASSVAILAATATLDRWEKFEKCCVLNNVLSSSTALTGAVEIGAASSPNGFVLLKDCSLVGCTHVAFDTTTEASLYVDGAPPTNTSSGLAVLTTSHG